MPNDASFDTLSLPLPVLVFSSSLHLVRANAAAHSVFDIGVRAGAGDNAPPRRTAAFFFREHATSDGVDDRFLSAEEPLGGSSTAERRDRIRKRKASNEPLDELRAELNVLAKEGQFLSFGDTSTIAYWTGPPHARTARRAEAIVQLLAAPRQADVVPDETADEAFVVTLIRPIIPKPSLLSSHSASSSTHSGSAPPTPIPDPASTVRLNSIISPYVDSGLPERDGITNTLPQIIFTCSPSGDVTFLNPEWYSYTGITKDGSFETSRWVEYFHPSDVPSALESFAASLATGSPINMEYRIKGATGEWRWFVARGAAVRDAAGVITGWVAALTDVEELVRVRSEALDIRARVLAVLSGADVALFSVDLETTVTWFEGSRPPHVSPPMAHSASFVGSPLEWVWPEPKLQEAVTRALTDGIDGESQSLLAEVHLPGESSKWYRYRLVPMHGTNEQLTSGVIVVAANVTGRVKAEESLQAANQQRLKLLSSEAAAREASRLKSEFTTNLSHEIRTPIASIMGLCELLRTEPSLSEEHRVMVDQCLRCGEILLNLIGSILDFGKIEANELKLEQSRIKIADVIRDADLFSVNARKRGLMFEVEIPSPLYDGFVIGDSFRIIQVLSNGLSNAIKFTETGGVVLRVVQQAESPEQVLLTFEIRDTGCGIPEDVLPTLFQPFRQADASTARTYGGSGLGLVIAKSLVTLMAGSVSMTSEVGVGTTFTIHVPFTKAKEISAPSLVRAASLKLARKPEAVHILVADDNELILSILTRTLRKLKFQVTGVPDGEAAVAAAEGSAFDLLLLDCHMPRVDGYEATRRIRQSSNLSLRKVKIIALTASAIKGDRERCLEAGFDRYLAKPVRTHILEAAIWEALDEGAAEA